MLLKIKYHLIQNLKFIIFTILGELPYLLNTPGDYKTFDYASGDS
jgi:hypothetical protein